MMPINGTGVSALPPARPSSPPPIKPPPRPSSPAPTYKPSFETEDVATADAPSKSWSSSVKNGIYNSVVYSGRVLYAVPKVYSEVVESAGTVAADAMQATTWTAKATVNSLTGDFSSLREAGNYLLGGTNFQQGVKAFKKKTAFVKESSDGTAVKIKDNRKLATRTKEAVTHFGYGVTKAVVNTTLATGLVVGTISNHQGWQVGSNLSWHAGAKVLAHVSGIAGQATWGLTQQLASKGWELGTEVMSSSENVNTAATVASLAVCAYQLGVSLRAMEESESHIGKFKAGASAVCTIAVAILPAVISFTD